MFQMVNKLKESSLNTFRNVVLKSWQQSKQHDGDSGEIKSLVYMHNDGETVQHLPNNNNEDESDEDEGQDQFLTEILEILNVDPERRNDREEIRRKLAMGTESDDYYGGEKMTKKPSLTTRLQSGMNLQICFMNETASDHDSQGSDYEDSLCQKHLPKKFNDFKQNKMNKVANNIQPKTKISARPRPSFFKESLNSVFNHSSDSLKNKAMLIKDCEDDFLTKQAKLQAEARMALAQAKDMAHMQMEIEKQRKKKSPIAEMVGIALPDCRRRLTRQVITGMNVAQLQLIVNDFHSQIETLNEDLVKLLLERDDLHMEQDSMLVDIEDLSRYLGDKEDVKKRQGSFTKKYKKEKK